MQKGNRRSFLGKVTLGISGLVALPYTGIGRWLRGNEDEKPEVKTIRSKKALGFQWDTLDPFLFCVHHEDDFPKGNLNCGPDPEYFKGRHMGDDFIIKDGFRMYHGQVVPGFPGHPHRGFETITVVRKGFVDHADSMGASGRYGNGDVQWMTAGKGVQHSEMFPLLKEDQENPMELFQIWLNLPKINKMADPHYKMLWSEEIPVFEHEDDQKKKTHIEVIAGSLEDHKAPAPPPDSWAKSDENTVAIWNISMEAGAVYTIPKTSAGTNRMLYFYEGNSIDLNGEIIEKYHGIEVEPTHDLVIKNPDTHGSSILVLQGKPIGEPVIQYGPFVMNTKQEIQQAFDDYHKTQFGGWPWNRRDVVHDRKKGRFAKHADGTEEVLTNALLNKG